MEQEEPDRNQKLFDEFTEEAAEVHKDGKKVIRTLAEFADAYARLMDPKSSEHLRRFHKLYGGKVLSLVQGFGRKMEDVLQYLETPKPKIYEPPSEIPKEKEEKKKKKKKKH